VSAELAYLIGGIIIGLMIGGFVMAYLVDRAMRW
jgi:hypothetical protein